VSDEEQDELSSLGGKIDRMGQSVNNMAIELGKLLQRNADHDTVHRALEADVWGIKGNPAAPGLIGRQLLTDATLAEHQKKFESLERDARQSNRRLWNVVKGAAVAIISGAVGFYFKHFTK
jgi:hypothetical protein